MNRPLRTVGLLTLVAGVQLLPNASADAGEISRLVIFGDSLSDTGNVDILTFGIVPGSPYVDGRFSNGPVWVEALASSLGAAAPTPSVSGGTNYAHGGAETGGGFISLIIPNMAPQVSSYLSDGPAPASGDLFVLLGGGNDFLNGQTSASTVVSNLRSRVLALAAGGAEEFLVVGLPPLGQTPGSLGTPDEPFLDALSMEFNDLYGAAIAGLDTSLGVTIHRLDLFELFEELLAAPELFGFTNITDPAYNGSTVAPNADEYVFWDNIHPTQTAHAEIGARAASRLLCPADTDGNGQVDIDDIVNVVLNFDRMGFAPTGDVNGSGRVDIDDIVDVILAFGPCGG
jgi:phospholipase/lecithinase/hemolysin